MVYNLIPSHVNQLPYFAIYTIYIMILKSNESTIEKAEKSIFVQVI